MHTVLSAYPRLCKLGFARGARLRAAARGGEAALYQVSHDHDDAGQGHMILNAYVRDFKLGLAQRRACEPPPVVEKLLLTRPAMTTKMLPTPPDSAGAPPPLAPGPSRLLRASRTGAHTTCRAGARAQGISLGLDSKLGLGYRWLRNGLVQVTANAE